MVDSFGIAFDNNLTKQNVSQTEKEKLQLMRTYLKNLAYVHASSVLWLASLKKNPSITQKKKANTQGHG